MRILSLVLILAAFMLHPFAAAKAGTEAIAVVVNTDALTFSDVNDRTDLIVISSGLPKTEEIRARVLPQVIESLIDEQLMLQEARRLDLKAEEAEIQQGFNTIAQQNKMPPEKFKGILASSGINTATMKRQIESQILWGKVIQQQIRPQVNVNDADIDVFLERLNASKGKNEYLVASIFLPVEGAEQAAGMSELAQRLYQEINQKKAPFFKLAQQFSKAPGAANGGDMGWVQQGQLAPELDQVLSTLTPNNVSQPIKTLTGYYLLLLRDKRSITDASIPSRETVRSIIGTERLERAQRRYLMDLKSAAFIEKRV
jgi:peptidyl-prolyl cis-trans isomerase SurA